MRLQEKRGHRAKAGAPVVFLGCLIATLVGASTGCGKKTSSSDPASASASTSGKLPAPRASVSAPPPYTGPVGKLEGRIILKGDAPPDVPFQGTPGPKCKKAAELSAKLFRVSADGGLADAIVGVTEYEGSPPLPITPVVIQIQDCVYHQRTYTATKSQDFEVYNRDPESFLPHLNGAKSPSLNVAVPGTRTPLHPRGPGRYLLTDDLKHEWMHADVFVFAYRTHTVSKADGRFVIEGIPAGKSKLSVVHPSFGRTVEQAIEIKDGETLTVDLEMPFDKKKDYHPPGAASASASASTNGKAPMVPKVVPLEPSLGPLEPRKEKGVGGVVVGASGPRAERCSRREPSAERGRRDPTRGFVVRTPRTDRYLAHRRPSSRTTVVPCIERTAASFS